MIPPADLPTLLAGVGLGWLTLALGLLLSQALRRWLRAWRFGPPVDHGVLLVEAGRKLTAVTDQPALGKLLVEALPAELGVRRAALLLPDETQLIPVGGATPALPVNHAAVRWVASSGEAQPAGQGALARLLAQGKADLSWTRVWVPLMRGARLRGLWLLGAPLNRSAFSPEDLRCLTSIAREAAAVLEGMTFAEQERQTALEMRTLYRQVVTAREDERGRLTRELHDGVLQDLCAVTRDLKALEAQGDLARRSGETVQALRAICNDLRPPLLQQDLVAALRALVQELDSRSEAPVHFATEIAAVQLEVDAALAVFRITQEALNNAIQHAGASEIAVRLTRYPDRLRLTVADDGKGFSGSDDPARFVAQGHFGLAGMRERAAMVGGKLEIQSTLEYGSVIILELPLPERE